LQSNRPRLLSSKRIRVAWGIEQYNGCGYRTGETAAIYGFLAIRLTTEILRKTKGRDIGYALVARSPEDPELLRSIEGNLVAAAVVLRRFPLARSFASSGDG